MFVVVQANRGSFFFQCCCGCEPQPLQRYVRSLLLCFARPKFLNPSDLPLNNASLRFSRVFRCAVFFFNVFRRSLFPSRAFLGSCCIHSCPVFSPLACPCLLKAEAKALQRASKRAAAARKHEFEELQDSKVCLLTSTCYCSTNALFFTSLLHGWCRSSHHARSRKSSSLLFAVPKFFPGSFFVVVAGKTFLTSAPSSMR